MSRKTVFPLLVAALFLVAGFATAQDAAMTPAEKECADERDAALARAAHERDEEIAEAKEDYHDDLEDADSDEERAEAQADYNRSVHEAREDYEEEAAEIREDYQDCLADVRREAAHEDDHDEDDSDEDRSGRSDDHGDALSPRFIFFTVDADNDTIRDYGVGDLQLLDKASYLGSYEERRTSLHDHRSVLEVRWDDDRVRLHDNPTGLLQFKTEDGDDHEDDHDSNASSVGAFLLDFSDSASINMTDNGARVLYGDRTAILIAPHAEWISDDQVIVAGFASLHLPVRGAFAPQDSDDDHEEEVEDAIADRRLGGRVSKDNGDFEILVYDDMEINASGDGSGDDPLRVLVSAELTEGRTVVLETADFQPGQDFELRYFDVHDDGTRTEVVIAQADSLQDILDPDDDEGQPEYWTVHDANGAQVMVSIPHWSVHEITLAIGEFVSQPSVIVGAIAGVLGVGVATAGMFWPRRRDE